MVHEHEQIHVSSDDLQVLNKAGIRMDDITKLIHEAAKAMANEHGDTLTARPTRLTPAELAILSEGGASGVEDSRETPDGGTHQLALIGLQIEFKQIHHQSLDANQVAELLSISSARVRQLSAPNKRGLYSFRGLNDVRRYPQWQFHELQVIPHLRELLSVLSLEAHPVTVQRFMTTKNPDLEAPELEQPPSPRDWLIAGYKAAPVLDLIRDL